MDNNAMACVSWIAREINANLCHIKWEEMVRRTKYCCNITRCAYVIHSSYCSRIFRRPKPDSQASQIFPADDIHHSFVHEVQRTARRNEGCQQMHVNELSTPDEDSNPSSSVCDVALETGDDEQTPSDCIQRLPASDSQLEPEGENAQSSQENKELLFFPPPTQWQLNTDTYFSRVAGNIISHFYGNLPKGRPTLAFRQRMENASRKEKDFWTKADPDIDTWLLIFGQVR